VISLFKDAVMIVAGLTMSARYNEIGTQLASWFSGQPSYAVSGKVGASVAGIVVLIAGVVLIVGGAKETKEDIEELERKR